MATDPISPAIFQPLTSEDVELYDTIPDGTLYLKDFTDEGIFNDEKFRQFVERYIRTYDRDVRNEFIGAMSYGLWELAGKRIREIQAEGLPSEALAKRVQRILKYEFPENFQSSTSFEYGHEQEDEGASDYTLQKFTNTGTATGSATGRLSLSEDWLLELSGNLTGSTNTQNQTEQFGTEASKNSFEYQGIKTNGSTKVQQKDDSLILSLDGDFQKNFHPPADSLAESFSLAFSGEFNDIGPLSTSAELTVEKKDYTEPPPTSDFFQKRADDIYFNGYAAYKLDGMSLSMDYDFARTDSAEHYSIDREDSHSISAQTRMKLKDDKEREKGYISTGIGYGRWDGTSQTFGEDLPIDYRGSQVFGKVKTFYKLDSDLKVTGSGRIKGKETEGTFQGWYPAWDSELKLEYNPGVEYSEEDEDPAQWKTALTVKYEGKKIDLNEYQEQHKLDGQFEVLFRPMDGLTFKLTPGGTHTKTSGYQGYEQQTARLNSSVSFNLPFLDPLWVWAYAGGYLYSYTNNEGDRFSGNGWWAGAGLSADITG